MAIIIHALDSPVVAAARNGDSVATETTFVLPQLDARRPLDTAILEHKLYLMKEGDPLFERLESTHEAGMHELEQCH